VPPEYDSITIPPAGVTKTFDITITVPLGTSPGTYIFHITADADGADYGEQTVNINVIVPHPLEPSVGGEWAPVPQATLSSVNRLQMLAPWIALTLMIAITASYVVVRRVKKRQN
jgi:hypothetical protein